MFKTINILLLTLSCILYSQQFNDADILIINDHAGDYYLNQYESFFESLGFVAEKWNVEENGALSSELINYGWSTILLYGNGGTELPVTSNDPDPGFAEFLNNGGNLLVIDQDLFSAHGFTESADFIEGDFIWNYFGISNVTIDIEGYSDSTIYGGPFPEDGETALVMNHALYGTENSFDIFSVTDYAFVTYPNPFPVGVSNQIGDYSAFFLSFMADASVEEGCPSGWYEDCVGLCFDNNDAIYTGYDCVVDDGTCEDVDGDGEIFDWLGDGYCDDGTWEFNFQCDEYGWDCGDCEETGPDPNGYCDDGRLLVISAKGKSDSLERNREENVIPTEEFNTLMDYFFFTEFVGLASPPFLSDVNGPTGIINSFGDHTISADISDYEGDAFSVEINWSIDNIDQAVVPMTLMDETNWQGILPGVNTIGSEVIYTISATDATGRTSYYSQGFNIFEVENEALIVFNTELNQDSINYFFNDQGHTLAADYFSGGLTEEHLGYYNTVIEITTTNDWGTHIDHYNFIENWLDAGHKNYLLGGDDSFYLLSGFGEDQDTTFAEGTFFYNLGLAGCINDFDFTSTNRQLLAESETPITGELSSQLDSLDMALYYDPVTVISHNNYIDAIDVLPDNATGVFELLDVFNNPSGEYAGVYREWDNGNKTVYLAFDPKSLVSYTIEDTTETIIWGSTDYGPLFQAAMWFDPELIIDSQLSNGTEFESIQTFKLYPAYPNPFNPQTTLSFEVPYQADLSLDIYDLKGQLVKELVNNKMHDPGYYSISWDASDVASSIYFVKLHIQTNTENINGSNTLLQKIILLK